MAAAVCNRQLKGEYQPPAHLFWGAHVQLIRRSAANTDISCHQGRGCEGGLEFLLQTVWGLVTEVVMSCGHFSIFYQQNNVLVANCSSWLRWSCRGWVLPPRPQAAGVPGAPPALGWQCEVQDKVSRLHHIRMLNRRLTVFSQTLCRGKIFESHDARKLEQLKAMLNGRPRLQRWGKLEACGNKKKASPPPSASVQWPNHQGKGTSPIKACVQASLRGSLTLKGGQWRTMVGDSLLQGLEAPMVHLERLSWELCCLQSCQGRPRRSQK